MKLYLAGMHSPQRPFLEAYPDARMLTSYFYARSSRVMLGKLPQLPTKHFLDSGAFSAATRGVEITVEELAEFWHAHGERFEVCANLDVLGDAKASARNLTRLRELGVNALPVWHFRSSLKELERIVAEHDHFAIGQLVGMSAKRDLRDHVLAKAWEIILRSWPRKVHAFGVGIPSLLLAHPWYSSDSSSPQYAAVHGMVSRLGIARPTMTAVPMQYTTMKYVDCVIANYAVLRDVQTQATEHWRSKGVEWND